MNDFISASDARSWRHCLRKVWYDHKPPKDFEVVEDHFEVLVQEFGKEHEDRVKTNFGGLVKANSVEHTQTLIDEGVPAIYQPHFVDTDLKVAGRPDFLIRTASGQYQIADAKLANSLRNHPELRIQLATYRALARSPLPALAYLGSGTVEEVGDEDDVERDKFIQSMTELLAQDHPPETHFGESKCSSCPYDPLCRPEFKRRQELTLVYGLDARSVEGLKNQGINAIEDLAQASAAKIDDVPYLKGTEKKQRLILQAKSYLSGQVFQLKPIVLPSGTWVHLDVEVNPLSGDLGSEAYLWGFLPPSYADQDYDYCWSDSGQDEDRSVWLDFLAKIRDYGEQFPNLVLAHFTPYEVTQIKTYAQRYDMMDDHTVSWLLGSDTPLFDLARVVKDSLILPLTGYGLKKICKDKRLVNFSWRLSESGAQWSVVRYVAYLRTRASTAQASIREEILTYNRDDALATRALECWLRRMVKEEIVVAEPRSA